MTGLVGIRRAFIVTAAYAIIQMAWLLPAGAGPNYGPGVTDTEIKLGQTAPYSGPASGFSLTSRVENAYFRMINEKGGIGGRKITMISRDDGYSPPKAVEQTRSLVEGEEVFAIMGTVGTLSNIAAAKYLNAKHVPQLMGTTGTDKLDDPAVYPWTVNFYASQVVEAKMYARYILEQKPDAKIAVLYQNDEYGKGYLNAFKSELGDKAASLIIREEPYEQTSPTIDSQIVTLKASGADTFFHATSPKFAAQAIRRAFEIGWKPTQFVLTASAQISTVLTPAGIEASTGVLTAVWRKEPDDKKWQDDKDVQEYLAFMKQWAPAEPVGDGLAMHGYVTAQMIVEVLKRCGDDLTRKNLMTQVTSISDLSLPLFIPGVLINISSSDRTAWRSARIAKFDGKGWEFVSEMITVK